MLEAKVPPKLKVLKNIVFAKVNKEMLEEDMLGTKNGGKWWTRHVVSVAEYRWWLRGKGGTLCFTYSDNSNKG